MNKANFMVKDQRSESVERKELRKLLQIGNIMSLALISDKSTEAKQELAMSWPEQVERARIAGSFK